MKASSEQVRRLFSLLSGVTKDKLQNIIENFDLVAQMLKADLSKVDRATFAAALHPQPGRENLPSGSKDVQRRRRP